MAKTPEPTDSEGLTVIEALYVDEYMLDLSQKHAAIRAGIKASAATAWATRAMKREEVKDAIEKRIAKKRAKLQRTRDRLLKEMEHLSFSRAKDYTVNPLTGIISLDGVPVEDQDAAHACIKSIEHEIHYVTNPDDPDGLLIPTYKTKITLWDKNTAHRNLGQHLGMFIERHAEASDGDTPDGPMTTWDFGGKKVIF